jgi:hypothetical protein
MYNLITISVLYSKVKVIPEDIDNLLTPVALAHWIMGDGLVKSKSLVLCTDSYSIQSNPRCCTFNELLIIVMI